MVKTLLIGIPTAEYAHTSCYSRHILQWDLIFEIKFIFRTESN